MESHIAILHMPAMVAQVVTVYVQGTQHAHAQIMHALEEVDRVLIINHAPVLAVHADLTHHVMVNPLEVDVQTYAVVGVILLIMALPVNVKIIRR